MYFKTYSSDNCEPNAQIISLAHSIQSSLRGCNSRRSVPKLNRLKSCSAALLAVGMANFATGVVAQVFPPTVELLDLIDSDGSEGLVLRGIEAFDRAGHKVSAVGDINGDGFDDVAIARRTALESGSEGRREEVYVVFGGSEDSPEVFELSNLAAGDGSTGFLAHGNQLVHNGLASVSNAGEINADGLIIGLLVTNSNTGRA